MSTIPRDCQSGWKRLDYAKQLSLNIAIVLRHLHHSIDRLSPNINRMSDSQRSSSIMRSSASIETIERIDGGTQNDMTDMKRLGKFQEFKARLSV